VICQPRREQALGTQLCESQLNLDLPLNRRNTQHEIGVSKGGLWSIAQCGGEAGDSEKNQKRRHHNSPCVRVGRYSCKSEPIVRQGVRICRSEQIVDLVPLRLRRDANQLAPKARSRITPFLGVRICVGSAADLVFIFSGSSKP
jgi:hypothetical protein